MASFLNKPGLPIGLRNNNPGNLRLTTDVWKGQTGSESGFVTFSDLSWGVRAMATVTAHDINSGLDTLAKYINSYAPPSENDTAAYVAKMAAATGFAPDQVLPKSVDTIKKIITAQMDIELGPQFAAMVPPADIDQGLQLMNSQILSDFDELSSSPGGLFGLAVVAVAAVVLFRGK
jgi:hypothetical protein